MERIVLDTNCLIHCIAKTSPYHHIWLSILDGKYTLCVTTDILNEYAEILEQHTSPVFASLAIEIIATNPFTEFIDTFYNFNLIHSDPDDNKFVNCAITANAKFIVTEDKHFNILKQISFPKVDIIGLDDFLAYTVKNL